MVDDTRECAKLNSRPSGESDELTTVGSGTMSETAAKAHARAITTAAKITAVKITAAKITAAANESEQESSDQARVCMCLCWRIDVWKQSYISRAVTVGESGG
jgi:hypothetical protein